MVPAPQPQTVVPAPSQPAGTAAAPVQPTPAATPPRVIAPLVLPKPVSGGATFPLTVDAVDYDEQGRLRISGHAEPGAVVHLYLNNHFIGRVETDDTGVWSLSPNVIVQPGLYAMRVDQVDAGGKVLARVQIPFSRAETLGELPAGGFVVVQPGNSLWRIARRTYGSGFAFSSIYDANKNQIRDPDLIYPGQIFTLPTTQ